MRRLAPSLICGLVFGTMAACVDRAIEPNIDPEPYCIAFCEQDATCGLAIQDPTTCLDDCMLAAVWERSCASVYADLVDCVTDLSCQDLELRRDSQAERSGAARPCGEEDLQFSSCLAADE